MENMTTADLARQIKATPPEDSEGYQDVGIDRLINRTKSVWRDLLGQEVQVADEGYAVFDVIDTSDSDCSSIIVGGVDAYFVDKSGYKVRLGGIRGSWLPGPSAEVNVSPADTEPLFPSDERWDTVVGTIGRAILACKPQSTD